MKVTSEESPLKYRQRFQFHWAFFENFILKTYSAVISWRRIDFPARSKCLHLSASFPNTQSNSRYFQNGIKTMIIPFIKYLFSNESRLVGFLWRTHLGEYTCQFNKIKGNLKGVYAHVLKLVKNK